MKLAIGGLVLLALAGSRAAEAQSNTIDLADARLYFAELRQLSDSDGGRLWGRPLAGPTLFAAPGSRTVVANMTDLEGALSEQDGVWVGTLPENQNIANTAIDWAGRRWTMVVWPVSDSRYARRRLLLHESFHRIQGELGLPGDNPANAHLATAEGRIWMRLEWRALTEALLWSGEARTAALRDALTFRARRRLLSPEAAAQENALELNEGLAEYTGYAASGLPSSALHERVAAQLANYEQQDNFARSFAYASGPAYALLLDAGGQQWRRQLSADSDLAAMAMAAYRISGIDPATADSRTERYTAARMIREEHAREAVRAAAVAKYRAQLVDGPVVTLPVDAEFRYSFDPNAATPLNGVGTVFDRARVTDTWGVLEVTSGGVLLRRSGAAITGVVVPAPAGESPPLRGDGWELKLESGWRVAPGTRAGGWIVEQIR